jgi:SAM-dependent methyltransferase
MKNVPRVIAANDSSVYYTGNYWNDFPYVQKQINIRATGDPKTTWYEDFFKRYKKPFNKALILNCGNGWVERKLYESGYIKEVVGVDYSNKLLDEARKNSKGLPFRYYKMDINVANFTEKDFDLVINHAAVHHIARLDKVLRSILRTMTDNGVFVNYDYIGAHRNQYNLMDWEASYKLNQSLLPSCQQDMSYPHLPTMLATDPSEAVHAELILLTMKRYFKTLFYKPLGGALAYPILTHNKNIQKSSLADVKKTLGAIMEADSAYLTEHPSSSLFAYWAVSPKKSALQDKKLLAEYSKQEARREKYAVKNNGHYYQLTFIQQLYTELEELRIAKQHKQSYIEELQKKISELEYVPRRTLRTKAKHAVARLNPKFKRKDVKRGS